MPRVEVKVLSSYNAPFDIAKDGDVGHDLYAQFEYEINGSEYESQTTLDKLISEIFFCEPVVVLWPFTTKTFGSGIKLAKPSTLWALIKERSSTMKKHMFVMGGIIDSGYRGEYLTSIRNLGLIPRVIRMEQRLAQVVFIRAVRPAKRRVNSYDFAHLPITDRGATGFGSSGR